MKEKHILDCYKYTLSRLKELGAPYEEQKKATEDFALWNLPTELSDDWCNMEYFIKVLYDNKKIDDNIRGILFQIKDNFEKCTSEEIFTHEGMKYSEFWAKQRQLAKQALQLMYTDN